MLFNKAAFISFVVLAIASTVSAAPPAHTTARVHTTTVTPTTTRTHTTTPVSTITHTHTTTPTPTTTPGSPKVTGKTVAIISDKEYCLFLPPVYGGGISENEDKAVAFCTNAIPSAPKAGLFPAGFVKSAHLVRNTRRQWVQLTGRIDRSKYGLSAEDGGGQYDNKAPVSAKCAGYNYFVELVEPDVQIYCIRCCKNKADCPVNKSTYGCKAVLGGNYS